MLLVVATLNIIDGIAAISKSKFFVATARYVLGDLRTWGWIILAVGVLQMLVGFGIWVGNQLARCTGVVIVSINMIAQRSTSGAVPARRVRGPAIRLSRHPVLDRDPA